MGKEPTLYLCTGKSCRKALAARPKLAALLPRLAARVEAVGCQKICDGVVVGLEVEGRIEWFRRLGSRKSRRALRVALSFGRLRASLARRRVKRRSGRLRG